MRDKIRYEESALGGERMVQWSRTGPTSRLDHDARAPALPPVRCGPAGLTLTWTVRRTLRAGHDSVTNRRDRRGGMPRIPQRGKPPLTSRIAADCGAAWASCARPDARAGHPRPMTTREIVTAYIRAIEAQDGEAVARYMHPDIEVTEHPNRISPAGLRADLAGVRTAWERGRKFMADQRYDIRHMIVEGDRAAVQFVWSGTLAVAAGSLPAGHVMQAQICSIIELKDGKVWRQEQYDCYL
jgi:ketosteroid isomerase-like protein